ncbi:hypothetical protein ACMX25_38375 [Caballeronia sp. 15715]|uniref:hypothetical protein n=1 Tax=Caballeronia sp. 15715 TaxID=3391030 RepID=UPI0039E50F29
MEQVIHSANVAPGSQIGMASDAIKCRGYTLCETIEGLRTGLAAWRRHTTTPGEELITKDISDPAGMSAGHRALPAARSSAQTSLDVSFGFYASLSFLSRYGRPANPEDLKAGQFMSYKRANAAHPLVLRNAVSGCRSRVVSSLAIESESANALVKAAVRGLGVVFVPRENAALAIYRCELVQVMHEWIST